MDFTAEDDEALRQFMPTQFGKKDGGVDVAAQIERCRRPVVDESKQGKVEDKDSDDDSDDEDEDEDEFPVSHELIVKTHDRAVTTIALDPSG